MKAVRILVLAGSLLSAAVAASCGSDDETNAGGASGGPLYVVNTSVFLPDTTSTYFAALGSLEADKRLDIRTSLEAPGMAKLYARDGLGWFALGGGEAPTITRYGIDDKGTFVAGQTISLQPRGTTFMGDTVVFVSDTKAYYFDAPNHQLIRWNPEAMTVDGAIQLPMTAREGLTTIYDVKPLLRADGKLLFPVSWRNFETDATNPVTGLVVIDTRTDALVKYVESPRCQGVTWSTRADNGDLYLATAPFYAVLQRATSNGPAACVQRVKADSDVFDPDYLVDLASLVGGRVAGGLARGPSGNFFFRAVEPGTEIGPSTLVADVWSGAVWRWVQWNPTTNETRVIDTLPPSASGGLTYEVDGKVFATDSAADFSSTTLIDMTAAGGPQCALSAPGYIYGVARVR